MDFGVIYGGVPSLFCFDIRGWSHSNFLASTVVLPWLLSSIQPNHGFLLKQSRPVLAAAPTCGSEVLGQQTGSRLHSPQWQNLFSPMRSQRYLFECTFLIPFPVINNPQSLRTNGRYTSEAIYWGHIHYQGVGGGCFFLEGGEYQRSTGAAAARGLRASLCCRLQRGAPGYILST